MMVFAVAMAGAAGVVPAHGTATDAKPAAKTPADWAVA